MASRTKNRQDKPFHQEHDAIVTWGSATSESVSTEFVRKAFEQRSDLAFGQNEIAKWAEKYRLGDP
jgi:hypothetical protein